MKFITEHSHFEVIDQGKEVTKVKNLTTKKELVLSNQYIKDNCVTDDTTEQLKSNVTQVREYLEGLPSGVVFKVIFKTKDDPRSKSAVKALRQKKLDEWNELVNDPDFENDGFDDAAEAFIQELIENPILEFIPGEVRELTCYKTGRKIHGGRVEVVCLESLSKGEYPIKTVNPQTVTSVSYRGVERHV